MRLDRSNFDLTKQMLESADQESVVVAMSILETSTLKDNLMYILLLAKESNIKTNHIDLWDTHAPTVVETIKNMGINIKKPIPFTDLVDIIRKYDVNEVDVQLFFNIYAEHLQKEFSSLIGKDLIKTLTIKINTDEGRTISKSIKESNVNGAILRNVSDNAKQEVEH